MVPSEQLGVEIMLGCAEWQSGAERRERLKMKRLRRRELKNKQNITFRVFMAAVL